MPFLDYLSFLETELSKLDWPYVEKVMAPLINQLLLVHFHLPHPGLITSNLLMTKSLTRSRLK